MIQKKDFNVYLKAGVVVGLLQLLIYLYFIYFKVDYFLSGAFHFSIYFTWNISLIILYVNYRKKNPELTFRERFSFLVMVALCVFIVERFGLFILNLLDSGIKDIFEKRSIIVVEENMKEMIKLIPTQKEAIQDLDWEEKVRDTIGEYFTPGGFFNSLIVMVLWYSLYSLVLVGADKLIEKIWKK